MKPPSFNILIAIQECLGKISKYIVPKKLGRIKYDIQNLVFAFEKKN